ncbi:DUF4169 family protein [Insolitispirillum peregrinum]|uniref:DUF4169 domain-containing protein n=1 Tax=Insolitispirillum peregrinum TaxID=80876 RepID=A0A1N7NDE2_9PROT|nr:DUF4169 family protein [Insolitispirillum peregrinum]SIS96219.1 protein of unknown function [Insolitispirillum peregrinum]
MADIINLRQARKQKQRSDKDAQAAENRARFGQKKADKQQRTQEQSRSERDLDGKLRVIPVQKDDVEP